jgi:hypothetical protein
VANPTPFDLAKELHDAVLAAVAASANPEPKRHGVVHGQPAFDECCDGMLWSRWTNQFVTSRFPQPATTPVPGGSGLVVVTGLEVGMLRCTPGVSRAGQNRVKLPTAAELEASALELSIDAAALFRGIFSTVKSWPRSRRWVLGSLDPVDVDGRCAGSLMTLTAELCE